MGLPTQTRYLIIGAGIHGLSTAYHLAVELKASGKGDGRDILVIDKSGVASGASGIACGVVRNNYFQPAMRELMAHSVDVWEADAQAYHYHAVGYMQISPESMHEDVASIAQQQKDIGYESDFIEGEADCMTYMKGLFDDWQARDITSVLHEKRGGYANNARAMHALAKKATDAGVTILGGVTVRAFEKDASGAVTAVVTDQGNIQADHIVIGAGPWAKQFWDMLELESTTQIKGPDGTIHTDVPMWIYWSLQEGTLGVEPDMLKTNAGAMPPVIHVDSNATLYSDVDGSVITDKMWGIYYKPDFNFGGIQGGAAPFPIQTDPNQVAVDPYGPASPEFIVGDDFAHMWVSALAHCQKRFEGHVPKFKQEPSGGIGAFTPDSFPVFDTFCQNVYFLADSNHGYKMIGVGKLVAEELVHARPSALLEPFRFSRYAAGQLHPTSSSPFPWS
ncbi:FAD-dependent oxidoreductase [Litorivicinus lipolyticus]|uniref:FAD-dependent oxidoreductase n=2 Tax=Litorivicinus lipolyticus TaxID=418701 RepID=A0A5Q2QHE6_9GAMM|nr:FAD-binding oxidoreductase [Litorivicinus lipolyticus]QGG80445.1 FAD-dependent oxidoreductase [Litorivicinus lipolyticus]